MAQVRAINGARARWVRVLLVVGVPTLLALSLTSSTGLVKIAYGVSAVVLAVALVLLSRGRIDPRGAMVFVLGVAAVLYGVSVWALHANEVHPVEAGFFTFRAVAIVSGVVSLALGPRLGVIIGAVLVVQSLLTLVVLDVPLLGSVDAPVGIVQNLTLMAVMIVIHQAMASRLERLEQSAEEASESAELAFRDELTGLPNRRQLTVHLSAAAARAREGGEADAVVMFDLDHFKRINDTRGHDVGDEVLRRTAAIASAAVRDGDLVGRWGGEEFVALLHGADAEQARVIAERCRAALAQVSGPTAVTASFGVTNFDVHDTVTDALRRADLALYEAKQGGRNRVVVRAAQGPLEPPPRPSTAPEQAHGAGESDDSDDPPRWPGAGRPR